MRCSVPGCKSHYRSASQGISYFGFPKEADLRAKWVNALNHPKFQAASNEAICSLHFFKEDMISYGKGRRLRPDAIPRGIPTVIQNEEKPPEPESSDSTSVSRIYSTDDEQNNDNRRLKGKSPVEISLGSSSRACSVREPNAHIPLHRSNKRKRKPKKKQKKFNILEKFENILSRNPDDDQIFGDYVASSLRGLTDLNKQKLKILIQKTIIEFQELDTNHGNSNTQATFPSFETIRIPSSLRIVEVRPS